MLKIAIVSDIVCPWCFIGKRRLEAAIAIVKKVHPNFEYETHWLPFFLNPDTPPEGEPYLPFLEQKFGGKEPVEALFEHVRQAGRAYGLEYAFEKISVRANTLQAHRLLYWAQQRGNADALIERLFAAQFQHGELVGDRKQLINMAVECGYPEVEVAAYLESNEGTEIVINQAQQIRLNGIRMVPTFILTDDQVIVGAEDPAILAAAILKRLT